ncbi:MAG: type IV pilus modification PilV family protein [Planctomycetota bacterium]|jgi:type II secretory pathway pseudopilin PulG
MSARRTKSRSGVTLIEIIVATVVILVAIIGAMSYRYYSILDARNAKVYATAGRVGSLLLENWRGTGGRSTPGEQFDPQDLRFGSGLIRSAISAAGPAVPVDLQAFGTYAFIVDGATYYATLSYRDDAAEDLRVLNVCVGWPDKYPSGAYTNADQAAALRSVKFSTKVYIPTS